MYQPHQQKPIQCFDQDLRQHIDDLQVKHLHKIQARDAQIEVGEWPWCFVQVTT